MNKTRAEILSIELADMSNAKIHVPCPICGEPQKYMFYGPDIPTLDEVQEGIQDILQKHKYFCRGYYEYRF